HDASLNREREEGLDSSDSQKNHGNQPGEKDDIDEKSFHTIFIGLSAFKVKFFLVLCDSCFFFHSSSLSPPQNPLRPSVIQDTKESLGLLRPCSFRMEIERVRKLTLTGEH
ncbi:MAG: hypothetical protein CO149_02400, partial [Nitrospirae bacterium CG_4_9_14_3_um_filter_51_5]